MLHQIIFAIMLVAAAEENGSISGVVRDARDGITVPNVRIRLASAGTTISGAESMTDAVGRYRLRNLKPGLYEMRGSFAGSELNFAGRGVMVKPGKESLVDLFASSRGAISGRVIDEDHRPLSGIAVFLLAQEYWFGAPAQFGRGQAKTNENGEYTLRAESGVPYLLVAARDPQIDVRSKVASHAAERKPAHAPTFYGNAAEPGKATTVNLALGETRKGVDIVMRTRPSLCIAGTVTKPAGAIQGFLMVSGPEVNGELAALPPHGLLKLDGQFRVCDLDSGKYRLTAWLPDIQNPMAASEFGNAEVTLANGDVTEVQILTGPPVIVKGQVEWEGDPPEKLETRLSVLLRNANRSGTFSGEPWRLAASTDTGNFVIESVSPGDYFAKVETSAMHAYVKDVRVKGKSVLSAPFHIGDAEGSSPITVVLAHDGSFARVRVLDANRMAMPHITVVVVPSNVSSEGDFSSRMEFGETDGRGVWVTRTLAPGRYLALTTPLPVAGDINSIARLWRARSDATPFEVKPNSQTDISLQR